MHVVFFPSASLMSKLAVVWSRSPSLNTLITSSGSWHRDCAGYNRTVSISCGLDEPRPSRSQHEVSIVSTSLRSTSSRALNLDCSGSFWVVILDPPPVLTVGTPKMELACMASCCRAFTMSAMVVVTEGARECVAVSRSSWIMYSRTPGNCTFFHVSVCLAGLSRSSPASCTLFISFAVSSSRCASSSLARWRMSYCGSRSCRNR